MLVGATITYIHVFGDNHPVSLDAFLCYYKCECSSLSTVNIVYSIYDDMSEGIFSLPPVTAEQLVQMCGEISDPKVQLRAYEDGALQWPQLKALWVAYLEAAKGGAVDDKALESLYQRALVSFAADSLIWTDYLAFLVRESVQISWIRLKFNDALTAVPLEDHKSIWKQFLRFADVAGGTTGILILSRYLEYVSDDELSGRTSDPELWNSDLVILKFAEFGDAKLSIAMFETLTHDFTRLGLHLGRTLIQIWSEMMDLLLTKSTNAAVSEKIEQAALTLAVQFPDQKATVHLKLALFYISQLETEKVRHLLDSGIQSCKTIKDFVLLFDTRTGYEERLLAKMYQNFDEEEDSIGTRRFDYRAHVLDTLLDSRELMINDVLLRLDPHNLDYWFERLEIVKSDMNKTLETYVQAISSVNPLKCSSYIGHSLPELWINYSKIYSSNGDTTTADLIFSKAVESQYRTTDELADIFISWSDLLLEVGNEAKAVLILKDQLKPLSQAKIADNAKLWQYYIDLLESGVEGDSQIESVVNAYELMIDREVATVLNILSYALFLNEWHYNERAFSVYERGLHLFKLEPTIKFEIWNVYLAKLIGLKASPERIRDLFDQCIEDLPGKFLKPVIVLQANFEANNMHSVMHAVKSLREGAKLVTDSKSKAEIFRLLITQLHALNDPSEYRRNMEQIINNKELALLNLVEFVLEFIKFEDSQLEYGRVRQLYTYVTELASPKLLQSTWASWEKFELDHGNVDTYKVMLKLKRKVNKLFADKPIANPMGFIKSDQVKGGEITKAHEQSNPDMIEMDMD